MNSGISLDVSVEPLIISKHIPLSMDRTACSESSVNVCKDGVQRHKYRQIITCFLYLNHDIIYTRFSFWVTLGLGLIDGQIIPFVGRGSELNSYQIVV